LTTRTPRRAWATLAALAALFVLGLSFALSAGSGQARPPCGKGHQPPCTTSTTTTTSSTSTTTPTTTTVPTTTAPPPTPTPQPGYSFCAWEGAQCSFSGTLEVIYGAAPNFTLPRQITGGTPCTNAVFGDPAVGTVKHCETRPVQAPPPSTWGSGLGVVKFGCAHLYNLTRASEYMAIQTGDCEYNDANDGPFIRSTSATVYTYACGNSVPDVDWSSTCGVPIAQARASGWLLTGIDPATGQRVESHYGSCGSQYGYAIMAKIGDPGYQQAWLDTMIPYLQAHPGVDGVMLDDQNGSKAASCPAQDFYKTDADMRNATLSFEAAVSAGLHARGYKVAGNLSILDCTSGLFTCGASPCDGTQMSWWFGQVSPYLDAASIEKWQANWQDDQRRTDSATDCGHGFWTGNQRIVAAAESHGMDFFPNATGNDTNGTATYIRASFLLEVTRPTSTFAWSCQNNYSGACDPITSVDGGAWARKMGAPLGPKTVLASGAVKRLFELGEAIVNPTAAAVAVDGHALAPGTAYLGP